MSANRKFLSFGLTALTAVACILLLLIFYLTMRNGIIRKADDSIIFAVDESTTDEDYYYSSEDYFDVYYIDTQETDTDSLSYNESALYDYYNQNKDALDSNYLYTYDDTVSYMIFMPVTDGYDTYLYYVNVYPMLQLLTYSTYLLLAVIILMVIIISLLGYRAALVLDESDKRTKNFFANASHELKTPLMAIGGYAEGLEKNLVTPLEASKVITSETERMKDLVEYILNLSKIDSGMLEVHMEKDDLRELIYEIAEIGLPQAELKQIELRLDLAHPLLISYDENLMYSVISNILVNNLRYAKSFVQISADIEENELLIHISNDGTPISPQVLPHLFDRFYKGEGGQTGIGLALSLEYMRLHKGNIQVTSSESLTTFSLSIPK